MTVSTPPARRTVLAAGLALAGGTLGACSSGGSSPGTSAGTTTVSLALDWTPNTNHTGVYVADQLGYYADQGITLKPIAYASTSPETLVSHGKADVGFSYQAGVAYARAAGQEIVAVFSPHRKGTYAIGVSDDSGITRPAQLDGKVYAGFGTPDEGPELEYVIKKDGGTGTFRTVTLSTSAYEAVHSGKADFTIPVVTWEGVEAERAGKAFRTFAFTDYGFPEQYSSLIVAGADFLADTDLARRFLDATQQGYTYAAEHPEEAADLLVKANPTTLTDPDLVRASQQLIVDDGYLTTEDVGLQDDQVWDLYGSFLYTNGLLTDAQGAVLTTEPDWTRYYSNAYLPTSGQ